MGKARTSYDFLAELLEACLKPKGKTELYFNLRTQYDYLRRWLNNAVQYKLIEQIGKKYQTTQKGKKFLTTWKKLQTFLTEQ